MELTPARPRTGSGARRASCIIAAILALGLTSTASAQRSAYVPCLDAWTDSPAGQWCRDIDVDGEGETCRFSGGACAVTVNVTQADGSARARDFMLQPIYESTFTIKGLARVRALQLCFMPENPTGGWRLLTPLNDTCPAWAKAAGDAVREGLPYRWEWWRQN